MALFLFFVVATLFIVGCEETDDANTRRNAPIVTGREARGHTEQSLQDMTEKAIYLDTAKLPEDSLFKPKDTADSTAAQE